MGKNWKFKDLSNQTFGRLTVINVAEKRGKAYYWNCVCLCGNTKVVSGSELASGGTKSCGCLRKQLRRESGVLNELRKHPLYFIYHSIKCRTLNQKNSAYPRYGGRGITICEEWKHNFKAFYDWCMANGWRQGLHVDRRENNGNYEPGNCQFVTPKVNNFNKRNTLVFELNQVKVNAFELENIYGIPAKIISSRINEKGWDANRAVSTPVRKRSTAK